MKKRTLFFRIGAIVILLAIAAVMMVIGRGHTVYFDNKKLEYNGETYDTPYKVCVYVNDERVAKLYDKERGMATWIGQNFEMTLEITQEKGGDETTETYQITLPYNMDGIVINLPGFLAGLDQDAYITEFVPVATEETTTEEEAQTLRRYARQLGLILWSAHATCYRESTREASMAQLRHDAKIAALLDATVLVFHPTELLPDGSHHMDVYRWMADVAEENGLQLALETGIPTDNSMLGYLQLIDLVDAIDRPHVGICIDTGHSYMRDRPDVESVVRAVGNRLKTLHLHDNYGQHDDHQMPGLGLINWPEVIRALKESEYDGPLMLEMSDIKEGRTVPQLSLLTIEKEILFSNAYLRYLWDLV